METKKLESIYRLKAMVMARLMAEVTVLCILALLPGLLILPGKFQDLPGYVKLILPVLSLVALCVLPGYGFVTWKVTVNEQGIATRALFKKQFAPWALIKSLTLKTSWGWRRYVLSGEGFDLSFPVWLNDVRELTEHIRAGLPGGGRTAGGGARTYRQDAVSFLLQFGRLGLHLVFIVIFWMFFYSLSHGSTAHGGRPAAEQSDAWLILAACIVFTSIVVLRCLMIALIPRSLTVAADGITIQTLFFRRHLVWSEVKELSPPSFILPEGPLLKTSKGWFLLSQQLEASDELEDDLLGRLAACRPLPDLEPK